MALRRCAAEIDLLFLGVEADAFDPPGVGESQESSEESDVRMAGTSWEATVTRDGIAGCVCGKGQKEGKGVGGSWGADLGVLLVPPPKGSRGGENPAQTPKPCTRMALAAGFLPTRNPEEPIYNACFGSREAR